MKYFYPVMVVLMLIFIVDHRFRMIEKNLDQLNTRFLSVYNQNNTNSGSSSTYDLTGIKTKFRSLKYWEQNLNPAIDLVTIKKSEPNAVAFISIIDLEYPGTEICITPELKEKYLTSTFARENNCDVAINGEAGESMKQGCALGEWTGNLIVNGNPLLLEDSDKRPFLSFDKYNHSRYFKADLVDRNPSEEKYNTIWGRFDLLVDGEYIPPRKTEQPYSRTIMAINREGNQLFLMIVDGKRSEYSLGLSYGECAEILKELGAWNGMACDQGGSSCMYLKTLDGIINRPADSDGYERYVYTHFGVRIKLIGEGN